MQAYVQKTGLKYYNLIEKENEIGIDWNVDTYDEGFHLNVYGAEKTTDYFGKILAEQHKMSNRKSESELSEKWNQRLENYKDRKEKMEAEEK